jgi:uncharacterized protein YpbB
MVKKDWLVNNGEHRYNLTTSGITLLENKPLPKYLNGWNFHQITSLFWERLSLLIQVVSNLSFEESRYIPIQKNKDVHYWLKSILKDVPVPRVKLGTTVYSELNECFNHVIDIDPSLLVFRLTGFQQIGLTRLQVAQKVNLNLHDYQIGFTNTLHYLIQRIKEDDNQFKILPYLIDDLMQDDELTLTSRKTQKLLYQGYTLDKIANLRHLKLSTIEDHLVELALHVNDFSIDTYVDRELQNMILKVSRQKATKQLKMIKAEIGAATYFQIRLVLAKHGDR